MEKKTKIAVAMSGGVDSAVAAMLLKKQGYSLVGFHLLLWAEKDCHRCCGGRLLQAAKDTARILEIPFYTIDLKKLFKEKVVKAFLEEYKTGLTPNPCVLCNKFIRFGAAWEIVKKRWGCQYLATGHYCRLVADLKTQNSKRKTYHLLQAKDKSKDQSYFLYRLKQKQLSRLVFPLAGFKKKQVWQMAKKRNLPAAKSRESFDVCFTFHLEKFLKKHLDEAIRPGQVADVKGKALGIHQGLALYTVGSRGGWNWDPKGQKILSPQGRLPKYYVVEKKIKKNLLVVGDKQAASRKKFRVSRLNWLVPQRQRPTKGFLVRVRSSGNLLKCRLRRLSASEIEVLLAKPEFGITPGQSAVFYREFRAQRSEVPGLAIGSPRAGRDQKSPASPSARRGRAEIKEEGFEVLGGGIISHVRKRKKTGLN